MCGMGKSLFSERWSLCRQAGRVARRAMPVAVSLCWLFAPASIVRSKSDMRLWETVADRSAPLTWPWADGADSATLFFSNRMARTVASVTVARGLGETRGSCGHPLTQPGAEGLFDVALVQNKGGVEISRETALLAYVSCAGGGPITVRAKGTALWDGVRKRRVYAFDPAWIGEAGESGYDIAWPRNYGGSIVFR